MIIFVVALKAEISWLIDTIDIKLDQKTPFEIYKNDKISVIISGVGYINSLIATTYIINRYKDIKKIINIGIAGAKDGIKISSIYSIYKLIDRFDDSIYFLDNVIFEKASLSTYKEEKFDKKGLKSTLVDMEASAFYKACRYFVKKDKIYIIKVVSDNLQNINIDNSHIKDLFDKNKNYLIKELL